MEILERKEKLILVTGPTGAGQLLAVNREKNKQIDIIIVTGRRITIENLRQSLHASFGNAGNLVASLGYSKGVSQNADWRHEKQRAFAAHELLELHYIDRTWWTVIRQSRPNERWMSHIENKKNSQEASTWWVCLFVPSHLHWWGSWTIDSCNSLRDVLLLSITARGLSLPCNVTDSWGMKRWVHAIPKVISM